MKHEQKQFSEDEMQVVEKHFKRCLASSAASKMQI